MTPELSKEQRQAVEESHGAPVEFVDPTTKVHYVLMRVEMYERLKRVLDFGEPSEAEEKAMLHEFGKLAGWDKEDSEGLI